MIKRVLVLVPVFACVLSGCAKLEFHEKPVSGALSYYEPAPYFFVSTNKECVATATVVTLPGTKKSVGLTPGYGSSELSVSLNNGVISSVGQKSDTKVPETISAVASLATAGAAFLSTNGAQKTGCKPTASLYRIVDGVPSSTPLRNWQIATETGDSGSGTEKQ